MYINVYIYKKGSTTTPKQLSEKQDSLFPDPFFQFLNQNIPLSWAPLCSSSNLTWLQLIKSQRWGCIKQCFPTDLQQTPERPLQWTQGCVTQNQTEDSKTCKEQLLQKKVLQDFSPQGFTFPCTARLIWLSHRGIKPDSEPCRWTQLRAEQS